MNFINKKAMEIFIKFWPKILFSEERKRIRNSLRRITVQERIEDEKSGYKISIRPWAFIRVKDERKMLLASLNSILPVIDRGVIAYNDCTDGSDEIIEDFCKKHKGFIPLRYPYRVEPASSEKYLTGELKEENTLAGYYNAVLNKIPKGEWLIKIDVDQIYFPDILKHSFSLPKKKNDVVIYSRLNAVRDEFDCIKVCSYIRPGDHWLICNENLLFVNECGRGGDGRVYAFEHLKLSGRDIPYMPECSSIHFPYEKEYRSFKGEVKALMDLEDFIKSADPAEFSEKLLSVRDVMKQI